jgi:Tol biopolymer transport system component
MISRKRTQPIASSPKPQLFTVVLLQRLICMVLLLALVSCGGGNTLATLSPSPTPSPIPGPSPIPTPASQSGTIVFVSRRALDGSDNVNLNVTSNVWLVGSDGTNLKPLTRITAAGADTTAAIFSPDGRKLAFVSSRALDGSDAANSNGTPNIWTMNPDGSGLTALSLLKNVGPKAASNPRWSPDGTRLAFESARPLDGSDAPELGNPLNIWVMKADGTSPTPLTRHTLPGSDTFAPFWSPDGSKLTFASSQNAFVMNADGSTVVQLTKITVSGVVASSPLWSPDGTRLSFMSNQALDGSDTANLNFTNNIWVMKNDGTGATPVTRLTAFGANAMGGVWSPDNSKLLFISERALNGTDLANAANNVWVVNADGSGASPLTKLTAVGAGTGEFPTWSRDGSKIAFASSRALDGSDAENTSRTMNVWVMHSDGSTPTPLTSLTKVPADNPVPAWQP